MHWIPRIYSSSNWKFVLCDQCFPFSLRLWVLVTTILFHASISSTFRDSECDNIQSLSFSVWLISLGIMSSRFIHVVASGRISFLLMARWYPMVYVSLCVSVTQVCWTLCNPMDCIWSGSSVHGISQAQILKWVAISFSSGSSRPRDQTRVSHIAGRFFYCLSHKGSRCINTFQFWRSALGGRRVRRTGWDRGKG